MPQAKVGEIDKGGRAEEALREYFRGSGSYVMRGIPVREDGEDVTDIDLWIYTRASAHSRHVAIADIKNKKRSRAFERVVWVKGLQAALGADEAIIATQASKGSAQSFASRLGVRTISGSVLSAIVNRYSINEERLSLEELNDNWKSINNGTSSIKSIIETIKNEISSGLTFQALNRCVDEASALFLLSVERERNLSGPIMRAAFLCTSLVTIIADYLGKEHSFSDQNTRQNFFRQGLIFGRSDEGATKSYMDFAEHVATEFIDPSGASAAKIRKSFERAVEAMPVQSLVDLFSKPTAGSELFKAALALEHSAFAVKPLRPSELESIEAKAVIGIICDYAGLRRKDIMGSYDRGSTGSDNNIAPTIIEGRLL